MTDPRERMTERINASLLQLELKRSIRPLIVVMIGFAVSAAAAYYIVHNIKGGVGATHTMKFEVADATGVVPSRAEVRFMGIAAGQVSGVKLEHGHAVLTATVAKKFGAVYRDARAVVRPNTALQDMYLDIVDPGTPAAGPAGADFVVPLSQTTSPVNLAEVLDTFQPGVRTQLNHLIDQFGNGLQDRGDDLRRGFALLAPFLRIAGQTARQLATRAELTKRLVHNTSVLSATLASRSSDLRELVTAGTKTLEAVSVHNGAPLRQTIHQLALALDSGYQVNSALLTIEPLLDRVFNRLPSVVDHLPKALDDVDALARSIDPAVVKLQQPVRRLLPLSRQLRRLGDPLATSLRRIRPQVKDVDTVTAHLAQCVNEISEFMNWDVSMSKYKDRLGPMVRGNVHFGFYSAPGIEQGNYTFKKQCAGGTPIGGVPTPKYNGPPPTP